MTLQVIEVELSRGGASCQSIYLMENEFTNGWSGAQQWRGWLSNGVELSSGGAGCQSICLWKMSLLMNRVQLNSGGADCLTGWS